MMLLSIRSSIDDGFSVFFAWVPRAVGFVVVLLIGYLIAKVVGNLIYRATHRAGLDRTVHGGAGGNLIQRAVPSPSRLLGKVTFWVIFLGAVSIAASVLGIKALTAFVGAVWAYIPNVIAALLIFLIAGAVAGAVVTLVRRVMGDTALGSIVATAVPILVMTIATFMILEQLKIAPGIVRITYTALVGAIALAAALAFGLGGRDVAARMLEGAYTKGQLNKEQYKRDLDQGVARAKSEAKQKKDELGTDERGARAVPS
jgi:Mechanosensitive ion channel, conserved TM helix